MRQRTRRILTTYSQTVACCLLLVFFLITVHEAEACAPVRFDVSSAWKNVERVLGGGASYAHTTISPLTNTSRQRRSVDDSQAENIPLNPEKRDESQATLYCKDGNSNIAVGRSWVKNCIKYECTRDGIAVINQTHPPCPFLKTGAEVRQECRSVIVQDDDNCCHGLECPKPEEKPIGASNCLPSWTEFADPGFQTKSVCLKLSSSKRTFDAAARDCRRQMASLIGEDEFSGGDSFLLSIIEILRKSGIQHFWSGLHSRGDRFYFDKYLSIVPTDIPHVCRNGEDYDFPCGPSTWGVTCVKMAYLNFTLDIQRAECEENLHYVCIMESESWLGTSHIAGTNSCHDGWLFSPETKKCYKFSDERKNTFDAMSVCQRANATMTVAVTVDQAGVMSNALPVGSTTVPREIHAGLCLTANLEGCRSTTTPVSLRYNNGTLREWFCGSVNNHRLPWRTSQLVNLSSCYRRLPFFCEKDASGPTVDGLKVIAAPGGQVACTAARLGAVPGSYISWIQDGVFLMNRTEKVYGRAQHAFTCYTTDLNSGERIFSPFLVTRQGLNSMEVLQVSVRMTPDCHQCNLKEVCGIFEVKNLTDESNESVIAWILHRQDSFTYKISYGDDVRIVARVVYVKGLVWPVSRKSLCQKQGGHMMHVSKLPHVNDLSRVFESELRKMRANLTMESSFRQDWNATFVSELRKMLANLTMEPSFRQGWNATLRNESINVRSLRFCNPETIVTKDLGNVTTPRTAIDSWYNLSLCVSTRRPILAMYCQPDFVAGASWTAVIKSQCPDVMSSSELELKLLLIEQTNDITASKPLSSALSIFVNSSDESGVTVSEIIDLSSLVKNAVDALGNNRVQRDTVLKISETMPAIVSLVMSSRREHIIQAEDISHSSTLLTQSLEKLADVMSNRLEQLTDGSTITRVEGNLAIQVTRDPMIIGVGLSPASAISNGQVTEIRLDNEDIMKNFTAQITLSLPAKSYKKSFIVYKNNELFRGKTRIAASDVILSTSLEGVYPIADQEDLVRTSFSIMGLQLTDLECGFWSYDVSDWSTDGCKKILSSEETITCYCNHATSFAALMRPELGSPVETHESILTIVTVVGLSISVASLLLVMATFLMFKKMRQTISQKVLFNLSLAVFLLDVTFLIGIDRQESKLACAVFSALLHYFLLSSFSWMAVEAVLQYFRFVKVIGAYVPRFIVKASVPAWGIPAIIVGVICAKNYREYLRDDGLCWVNETVLYYGVLLPISIVMAFNSVVFGLIIRALLCRKNKLLRSNQSEKQLMRLHLRAAIALLAVMGLTWIFGFLMLQQTEWFGIICQYLFCIFNSAQGLLIMSFHCIREKAVIDAWKSVFAYRKAVLRSDDVSTANGNTRDLQGTKTEESLIPDANFYVLEERS